MTDTKIAVIGVTLMCVLIGLSCSRGVFADKSEAIRAVEAMGFTNAKVESRAVVAVGWRGCDEKDAAKFVVSAANPRGERVRLVVCSGAWLKGATIRGVERAGDERAGGERAPKKEAIE